MRYKSVHEIRKQRAELAAWFEREWQSADQVSDLAKAMLGNDTLTLAKAASSDTASASAVVEGLRKKFPQLPDSSLEGLALAYRMESVLSDYNAREDALRAEERRACRVNEIIANALPPYGPWSTVH